MLIDSVEEASLAGALPATSPDRAAGESSHHHFCQKFSEFSKKTFNIPGKAQTL
jgi:hypothetical protein